MWALGLHLLIGNAVIGIGEGLLLTRFFSVRAYTSVPLMIVANYASAWAGWGMLQTPALRPSPLDALSATLENGWAWFWVLLAAAYVATLVLEWPFVVLCVYRRQGWFRRSVRASLVVQSASYLVLFGWYWLVSPTSLYTQMHIVAPSALALPENVVVYYFSADGGDVYKRRVSGGAAEKICELGSHLGDDRLLVRRNDADEKLWDLVARVDPDRCPGGGLVAVLTGLAVEAAPESRFESDPDSWEGTRYNFGDAPRLGSAAGEWDFEAGFWSVQGLTAVRRKSDERVQFAFATPFGEWFVRNAIALPTDKVLFQLGADQICAFDPATRRVALLWRGRGAVAVIEHR